ncbi:MAG: hypothetical protein ABUL69_02810, partial [Peristeroidobacter soli]
MSKNVIDTGICPSQDQNQSNTITNSRGIEQLASAWRSQMATDYLEEFAANAAYKGRNCVCPSGGS